MGTAVVRPASRADLGPTGPDQLRAVAPVHARRSRNAALLLVLAGNATMSFSLFRAGEFLVSDFLYLAAGAVLLFKHLVGDVHDLAPARGRQASPLIIVGAVVLLTGGTLSSLRAWDPTQSMSVVVRFAWITLVWFWIVRTVCRDRHDLALLIRAWKAGLMVNAGAAILGLLGIAFVSTHNGDRQVGLTSHPNQLAAHLTAGLMLFLLAVPEGRPSSRRRERLVWFGSLALVACGLFSSGSLTALGAIAAALAVVGVAFATTRTPAGTRRGPRSPLGPAAVLVVLLAGTFALFTSDLAVVQRITGYREGDNYIESSINDRDERNALVTRRLDDFLVLGIGLNTGDVARADETTDDASAQNYGVHNMFLSVLYQAGLPALVGLFLILITAVRQALGLLRRADPQLYRAALALLGCVAAMSATAMFQPLITDRSFWMPIALIGCLWSIRRSELRADAGTWPPGVPQVANATTGRALLHA
jgi:O-Antigen ligase